MSVKLETTAGNLNSALRLMRGVVERRSTIPILGAVKFAAGSVTGTNLDMEVSVAVPTIGKPEGEFAVDYAGLAALARLTASDEQVGLSETDALAKVAFNGSEYRLASYPAVDFPRMDFEPVELWLTDNAGLVAGLRRVHFAVSTEELRYYLNGVAILRDPDGTPLLAATDGHMLAMVPIGFAPETAFGRIIHSATVRYLMARKGEPKAVEFGAVKARFEYDGLTVLAKLVDGTYPDILRVIPKETVPYFSISRAAARSAVRRLKAFSNGDFGTGIKLTAADGGISFSAVRGASTGREFVRADLSIKQFEVGYNVRYLVEILEAFTADTVTLAGPSTGLAGWPAVITGADDSLRVVIMPMRV